MRVHDFLTACIISLSLGSPAKSDDVLYDFDPIYLGAVGHFQPLDFYPVAVAIDHDNNVYEVDLFRKKVRIHDVTGSIIDEFPTGNGWFRDIDIDAAGNIYVADASGRIRKYGSNGELLLQFGFRGTTPGGFTRLRAMTIGHDGTIYVADKDTELSAFDSDGNLIWNNMKTVTPDGDLIMPLGITQDSLGNLYVADVSRNDVAIFNSAGQYLRNIKPNGNDYDPVAVAVDAEDTLYVLERRQYETHIGDLQIRKFTSNGEQLGAWAAKGRAPGELWEPQGMTLGPDGSIWVAGYMGHNIVRYDTSGNLISEWNDHDIKPYEFARVRGAVVGNNGDLYVTDFWNQVVQVFDRYGAFRFMFGERGQGDGQYFNFPRHTAANNAGDIFISDDGMIRRFAADGSFIARSEDAIPFAGGIEVDQLENVWVIGQSENTLRRYSQTLVLQEIIDGTEIPLGLNSPWGIAQGPNGKLYIADTLNHRIVRLTSTGLFDMAWGSRGVSPGQFSAPKGIVIDSHGYVYVSEEWNKRIQVFSADGDYLNGWDVPGVPDKDVGRPYELTLDGDYFLYAPDTTFGQAEVHKYALVPTVSTSGQPAYVSGEELGFYIWSENGSDWRIRWSSDGVLQEFSGTITSTTPIINFNNIDSEPGDQAVQKNSTRIDFTATETNGQDGIDIGISGEGIITFDLKIGGIERAHLVTIGSTSFHPSTLPVPLRTQAGTTYNTFGKPSYQPGQNKGYVIWQDAYDGEWHIRWTGDGTGNENFSGTITTTDVFSNVRQFGLEPKDSLGTSNNSINFDAWASSWHDGIDFFLPANSQVTFDLFINGSSAAGSVVIGKAEAIPSEGTISLVSQPAIGFFVADVEYVTTTGIPAYVPAQDLGYYLWQDGDDGEWHLRWSGDSVTTYQFDAVLVSTAPMITVQPYSFEGNDILASSSPTEIRINAFAGAGEDGIDFILPEGAKLTLNLMINNTVDTSHVFIGKTSVNPSAQTFTVLTALTSISPVTRPVYTPAQDLGYFLWQDSDDSEWHLRWSGNSSTTNNFDGDITSSNGFTSVKRFSYEGNDQLTETASALSFSAIAGAGEDGLDFTVPAASQLIFDILVDDNASTGTVTVGGNNASPATLPFSLYSP